MLGSFAFATSGAAAAKERKLDWFGVLAIAYLTACGGGIVRDLCLGTLPPVGISEWRYLACASFASLLTVRASSWVKRFKHPVAWFDSVGLRFFAVVGAHQSLRHGAGITTAIVLGTLTAVGGGMMRDVLLNRVPVILEKEIYALAALVAAVIQVVSEVNQGPLGVTDAVLAQVEVDAGDRARVTAESRTPRRALSSTVTVPALPGSRARGIPEFHLSFAAVRAVRQALLTVLPKLSTMRLPANFGLMK